MITFGDLMATILNVNNDGQNDFVYSSVGLFLDSENIWSVEK